MNLPLVAFARYRPLDARDAHGNRCISPLPSLAAACATIHGPGRYFPIYRYPDAATRGFFSTLV
jgi:hypothetical protein